MENDEMTNDAAVAWVSEYSLASLLKCRGDEHNGYIHAWMRPDDDYVVPLYSATTVAELRALIARAIPFLDDHHDAGPPSAGYKSDALESLITEMRNTLRQDKPE